MNEELEEPTLIKCHIDLPNKLPVLMTKILQAVDENLFSNVVLEKYIKALVEEWKNKVMCLSHQHEDVTKLKRTLGIQAHDELLVNYWLSGF
jgi:folliculin